MGFLALFAGVILIVWVVYSQAIVSKKLEKGEAFSNYAFQSADSLLGMLEENTVHFAAEVQDILLNHDDLKTAVPEIENKASGLLKYKYLYTKIQFLDSEGFEILRLEQNENGIVNIPGDLLDDLSKSNLFRNSIATPRGKALLSPMKLENQEGPPVVSSEPIVRAVAPVFNPDSESPKGLVVLTMSVEGLLEEMRKFISISEEKVHIVAGNGSWIISPDGGKEWSFQLKTGRSFKNTYPKIWQRIQDSENHKNFKRLEPSLFVRKYDFGGNRGIQTLGIQGAGNQGAVLSEQSTFYIIDIIEPPKILPTITAEDKNWMFLIGFFLVSFLGSIQFARLGVERQKAKTALVKEVKFQNRIKNTMADGLVVCNESNQIIYCNRACRKIFKTEEVEQGKLFTLLNAGKFNKNIKKVPEDLVGKGPIELKIKNKHGKNLVFEVVVNRIFYETENVFVYALRDITKRKRQEAKVRAYEKRFKILAEHGNDIIFHKDRNEKILYASPSIKKHLGVSTKEVIGKVLRKFAHPEDREKVKKWKENVIEKGKTFRVQARIRHADGSYLWFHCVSEPIKDKNGNITGAVTAMRNFDSQKKAVEEKETLSQVIEESLNEVFILDAKTLKITYANNQALKNLGCTRTEILKKNIHDLSPGRTEGELRKIFDSLGKNTSKQITLKGLNKRKDGSNYHVETKLRYYILEGKPVYLVFCEDVTERENALEELKQAEKLKALGHLTGGIAHDFNNLLTGIVCGLRYLEREKISKPGRECLEIAINSAKRGGELTQRLLAYSRKQELSPKRVNVNQLVNGIKTLLQRTITSNIKIVIKEKTKNLWVFVDPGRFENVLLNLAINSRDAMPKGGKLTIEIDKQTLNKNQPKSGVFAKGSYAVLKIKDNGSGMPEEVLDKALDPFFTTKEVGKGTGLGLSSVLGFVKQSKGHMEIESKVGKGTCVTIFLPQVVKARETTSLKTRN